MKVKVITASAGSGKTFRLSQLLDEALSNGSARPERIIATTFTNKAAAELTERARGRLLQNGKTQQAHELLAARIGTVNSVCGGLVTDFAFELGLSPALQIIDEQGAELELRRALATVVTTELSDELQRYNSRFCKESDWRHEVRNVISAARANGLTPDQVRACATRSIAELDACLGETVPAETCEANLASAIKEALASIDTDIDSTKGTKIYLELLADMQRAQRRKRLTWGNWAKLSSAKTTKKSMAFAELVQEAALAHQQHSGLRDDMHGFITQIFEIAAAGLTAYQEHKRQAGVIDFGDQEALALELLRNESVRADLEGQIDLVLIDEFQDTSPLQLAIFLELASLAKQSVWVGDPKQAIFGFRGTDPALMDAAIEALTTVSIDPELVVAATDAITANQVETLSTSFRSRPALVASTSEIFAKAFASHGMPEERTRLTARLETDPVGLGPDYQYWRLEPSKAEERPNALAGGIRDLLASKPSVRDKDSGKTRPMVAGDIAVLCRTNSQCTDVAAALVSLGLTPVLPSMELFDTAEAQLVLAGIRLWVDPRDAIAAATIARLLVYPTDLNALVDQALTVKGAEAFAEVAEVAALLAHRKQHKDLGLREVLDAVLSQLRVRHWCAAWGEADQRLANLDAIRNHLIAYSSQAASRAESVTLVGLLQYVEDMLDDWGWKNSRSDSKALIGGAGAITVSTWHRSKGLEWPVAILYGLESVRKPVPYGVNVLSDAPHFNVEKPLADRWIRFWPCVYTVTNQGGPVRDAMESTEGFAKLIDKADREALRVLYVGWTRARDQLIFAVQTNKFTKGLLGKLEDIDDDLISEPGEADTSVAWAGVSTPISVRSCDLVEPIVRTPVAGHVTLGRPPSAFVPARKSPSSAEAIACALGEQVILGDRFALRNGSEMSLVGDAVHAFLGADRNIYSASERVTMAEGLLTRFGVPGCMTAHDVVKAADRLWAWANERYPGAKHFREWPLAHRLPSGTMVAGSADLLLQTTQGFIVIDHKTFPGSPEMALDRARSYSGQLQAYSDAVVAATGEKVASMWIHFPVLGMMTQVVATTETSPA